MTAIANVALSNTFDYWRLRHNELTDYVNTEAANTGWAVSNTVFQSALANTNTAVADRLQVANASATFTSLSTFNSALANTNSYIATVDSTRASNLANTNSYIATRASTGKAIAMAIVFG